MSERLPRPAVFVVDGCVIDLQDVAAVLCHARPRERAETADVHVCTVILRSGVSFNVNMQYSRSLIQAVEWSRSPGSVVKPQDGISDQGRIVDNSWVAN